MKRLIAIICAVVLSLGLAACGGSAPDESQSPLPSVPESSISAVPPPSEMGKTESKTGITLPDFQITDKEVSLLTYKSGADQALLDQIARMKTYYDIDLTITSAPWTEILTKLYAMISSQDYPDVYEGRYNDYPVITRYLAPVTALFDINEPLYDKSQETMERLKFKDEYYAITAAPYYGYRVFYNKRLFEENDLTPLEDLFMNDEWDWNVFYDYANRLTDKSTGVYGIGARWSVELVLSTGIDFVTVTNNGLVERNWRNDLITRAMDFWRDIGPGTNGYMSPEMEALEQFRSDKIGMLVEGSWLVNAGQTLNDLFAQNKIGMVPFPRCPYSDAYYAWADFTFYSVLGNAKNPVGAAAFIAYMIYESRMADIDDNEYVIELRAQRRQNQIDAGYKQIDFDVAEKMQNDIKPSYLYIHDVADQQLSTYIMWQSVAELRIFGGNWVNLVDEREQTWNAICDDYELVLQDG